MAVLALSAGMAGCATSGNPHDPIEGFNRAMFSFNETVDSAVIKPVAKGYEAVLPQPVRTGVSNFFSNIADAWISINNLIQGKPKEAVSDLGRVLVNSTVGILGLFDVATPMGMEKHEEDFGQTLGVWGVGDGPYVVLPILGPRTLRDTGGLLVDLAIDPVVNHEPVDVRNVAIALRAIDTRAELLSAEKTIDEAALDKYSFIRDAYLQRRHSLIKDGNVTGDQGASLESSESVSVAVAGAVATDTVSEIAAPAVEGSAAEARVAVSVQ